LGKKSSQKILKGKKQFFWKRKKSQNFFPQKKLKKFKEKTLDKKMKSIPRLSVVFQKRQNFFEERIFKKKNFQEIYHKKKIGFFLPVFELFSNISKHSEFLIP